MNKKLSIGLVAAIIVIGGGYYLYRGSSSSPESAPPPPASAAPVPPSRASARLAKTYTVAMTDGAFRPASLTIHAGDTVAFRNNGTALRWPASDPHPTHTLCPGFDSLRMLRNGESYLRVFAQVGRCPYHDHLNPGVKGEIIVQP